MSEVDHHKCNSIFAALARKQRNPMAQKQHKKPVQQKTLANLEQNDCRWPIGDPKDPAFHFCGARKLDGRPYCQAHWQMAFQPSGSRAARPAFTVPLRRAA
jgi:hypothetical protein